MRLHRLAAAFIVAVPLAACSVLDEQAPAFDTAATAAMQTGGCLKLICAVEPALGGLSQCRVRPARCHRPQ